MAALIGWPYLFLTTTSSNLLFLVKNKDMENAGGRLMQPNRKKIIRLNSIGVEVDQWDSIRFMCQTLGYDRRAVRRVINGDVNYRTLKGCTFIVQK